MADQESVFWAISIIILQRLNRTLKKTACPIEADLTPYNTLWDINMGSGSSASARMGIERSLSSHEQEPELNPNMERVLRKLSLNKTTIEAIGEWMGGMGRGV